MPIIKITGCPSSGAQLSAACIPNFSPCYTYHLCCFGDIKWVILSKFFVGLCLYLVRIHYKVTILYKRVLTITFKNKEFKVLFRIFMTHISKVLTFGAVDLF